MLGVIGHWEHKVRLGEVGRRVLYQCFDYTARVYTACLVMVDVDGTMNLDVPKAASLPDALAQFPRCIPVYVHGDGAVKLPHFPHPRGAVYVVGPDYSGLNIPKDAVSVRIEVPSSVPELWSHTALGIVLHDRFSKGL